MLPDAAPPGVDSLFAGYARPAGHPAAAPSAPSSGRASPALGAQTAQPAEAVPAPETSAAAAAADAKPEQPSGMQPAGSGSAPDLQGLDIAPAVG